MPYLGAGTETDLYEMLSDAFDAIPKGINVVVISCTDPPQSFTRLIANQKLALIGWENLRFTLDEILSISRRLYPDRTASPQQIQRMNEHIQGWVSGLVLLLSELEFDREAETHGYLFDYFSTEILHKIDMDIRQFLLRTALLPKMTVSICERFTSRGSTRKVLSNCSLNSATLQPCSCHLPQL